MEHSGLRCRTRNTIQRIGQVPDQVVLGRHPDVTAGLYPLCPPSILSKDVRILGSHRVMEGDNQGPTIEETCNSWSNR
jgi:hypothetical protein